MKIIQVIQDLIRFKTQTGNAEEIEKCLNYMKNLFSNTDVYVKIFRYPDVSPVFYASNTTEEKLDALVIGHIDVVPAEEKMFEPKIQDGRIYGRGSLDMKSFAAVALTSLQFVAEQKLPLKFGVILSTDEEKESKSTEAFLSAHPDLSSKVVLDNDVGGDVTKIILKCKNPVFVKIKAKGEAAHGSTPWEGIDANEKLFQVWQNIRKFYPAFSKEEGRPSDTWIDTVHFASVSGGSVANIISDAAEALLDFRLTETSSLENLCQNLDSCVEQGVSYEIVSSSTPVVMSSDDPYICAYKSLAEKMIGQPVEFEYIGGATDSRAFAERGSVVIMHSGTGEGMHADNEYANIDSILQIAQIQQCFLKELATQVCC